MLWFRPTFNFKISNIMKSNILNIAKAIICMAVLAISNGLSASVSIEGNGHIVTREVEVGAFDEISNLLPARVNYTVSSEYSCRFSVDENLLEFLDIRVDDHKLKMGMVKMEDKTAVTVEGVTIRIDGNICLRPTSFIIEISAPRLEEIGLTGSGDFHFVSPVDFNELKISVAGSADVVFEEAAHIEDFEMQVAGSGGLDCSNLTAGKVKLGVAGSGDMSIKAGNIKRMKASVAGSGSIESHAELETLDASVAGSGCITAKVNNSLNYSVAGSGEVKYYGSPSVSGSTWGGSLKRLDGPQPSAKTSKRK